MSNQNDQLPILHICVCVDCGIGAEKYPRSMQTRGRGDDDSLRQLAGIQQED